MKNTDMATVAYEKPQVEVIALEFADSVLQAVSDTTVIGPEPVIPD